MRQRKSRLSIVDKVWGTIFSLLVPGAIGGGAKADILGIYHTGKWHSRLKCTRTIVRVISHHAVSFDKTVLCPFCLPR